MICTVVYTVLYHTLLRLHYTFMSVANLIQKIYPNACCIVLSINSNPNISPIAGYVHLLAMTVSTNCSSLLIMSVYKA